MAEQEFWEWFASQGGDAEGWKRFLASQSGVQYATAIGGIPPALKPYYDQWKQNIDTTPVTIQPKYYLDAAKEAAARDYETGVLDGAAYDKILEEIKTAAKYPVIGRDSPYLTEAIEIDRIWEYEDNATEVLDRKLELGDITVREHSEGVRQVQQTADTGEVGEGSFLYKESKELMSDTEFKAYKTQYKAYEKGIADEQARQEKGRLEGQQVVGEAKAKVEQSKRLEEFKVERERLLGAEFADTGQTGLDRDSPLDWQGKPLRPVTAAAEAGNIASVRAMEAAQAGSIPIEQVPGQAGDRLRQAIAEAKALGIDVSGVVGTQIGIKQMTTEIGERMIGQRVIALTNAITQRMASEEEQESSLLAKELPGGFKRFQAMRGEVVDPGRTGFEGYAQFVEDDPILKEQRIALQTRRESRFPQLRSAFQQAPFEERRKGFSKFITSTPELRSQLEKRTRPSRTRTTSFRPFRGR